MGGQRALHCIDLPFCFDNTDRSDDLTGGGPVARALAAKVSEAWIQFARGGNPNHEGLPHWPAFSAATCPTMIFNNTCTVQNDPDKAERRVIQRA